MKKRIIKLLVWLLVRLDEGSIKELTINKKIVMSFQKYIPKDGKWHQFGFSVIAWYKRNKKDLGLHELAIYKDAKSIKEVIKLYKF